LRYYEKIGIIEPSRSRGNIRLYSDRDIERLKRVRTLMEDLGVNLAGIESYLAYGTGYDRIAATYREPGIRAYEVEAEEVLAPGCGNI